MWPVEESESPGGRQAWLCDLGEATSFSRPHGYPREVVPLPLGIRGAGRYTVCAHGKNTFQVSLQTISELLLSLIVHILILSWHQKATRRPAGGFRVGSVPVLTVSKQSKEFGGVWGVSCLRSSSVVFRVQTAQSFAPPSDQQAL